MDVSVRRQGRDVDRHDIDLGLGASHVGGLGDVLFHQVAGLLAVLEVLPGLRSGQGGQPNIAIYPGGLDQGANGIIISEEVIRQWALKYVIQAGDHFIGDIDRALRRVAVAIQALQQPGHVDDPVVVHVGAREEVHRRDAAVGQGVAQGQVPTENSIRSSGMNQNCPSSPVVPDCVGVSNERPLTLASMKCPDSTLARG